MPLKNVLRSLVCKQLKSLEAGTQGLLTRTEENKILSKTEENQQKENDFFIKTSKAKPAAFL